MDEIAVEIGEPLVVGDVVMRPIAERRVMEAVGEQTKGVLARLQPLGVIVEDGGSSRALDLDGDDLGEDVLDRLDVGDLA